MDEEVKLFQTWSSSFALRVAMALKLKGIPYESILEDLSNKSRLLVQYNPVYKKIPVLLHNGKPLSESLVIVEYIDETWKHNPLLPRDPYDKAMTRFWARFGEDKLIPSLRGVLLSEGNALEAALIEATENLKILQGELGGKRFFGGEKIGYLDIAMTTLAYFSRVIEDVCGLKLVDQERFPLLSTWMEEFNNEPVIKELWPPRDKLTAKFMGIRDAYRARTNPTT